jgi:hypothetical protein
VTFKKIGLDLHSSIASTSHFCFSTAHRYVDNTHYTTLTVAGDDIAHNVTRVEFSAGAATTDGIGDGGVGGGRSIGSTHRILKTLTMQALGGGGGISKYGVISGGNGGGVGGSTGFTAVSAQTATLAASSTSVADASVPSSGVFRLDFMAPVSALTGLRVHCYGRNYSIPCMHAWTATYVRDPIHSHVFIFYGRDCNIMCTPHRAQRFETTGYSTIIVGMRGQKVNQVSRT